MPDSILTTVYLIPQRHLGYMKHS